MIYNYIQIVTMDEDSLEELKNIDGVNRCGCRQMIMEWEFMYQKIK